MTPPRTVSVRHGRLTLEIPEGWADESTVTYAAPVQEALTAALAAKRAPTYRSNLSVSVELKPDEMKTALEFLKGVGDALREQGIEIKDLKSGPFELGDHEGAVIERRVNLGGQIVRQWSAAAFIGPNVLIATASTAESEASKHEKLLLHLLGQVRST